MAVNEQGHYGKYSGNSRHSYNHAHTRVTAGNYEATKRDDEAHMDYLKRDVLYDDHHGHSDEKMTADEKHISKLAGDLKYDEKHHGPAKTKPDDKKKKHKLPEPKPAEGRGGKTKKQQLDEHLKNLREKQEQDLLNKYKSKRKPTD